MTKQGHSRSIPRWRRWTRWGIRLTLVLALGFLGLLIYLNQVGLPDFAKSLLQNELRANGLNLEFERLRWRLERGLVAEGIQLEMTSTNGQPTLVAEELKIRLDRQSLFSGTPRVSSVLLSNGNLGLPLIDAETQETLQFNVDEVQTSLAFPSPNLWQLENFHATCLGIQVTLQAEITNAFALKNWRTKAKPQGKAPKWPKILQQIIQFRNDITFTGTPRLAIKLRGDAAHPDQSTADFTLECDAMESPWGSIEGFSLQIAADESRAPEDNTFASRATLSIRQLGRDSSSIQNLQLTGNLRHDSQTGQVKSGNWTLNTGQIQHSEFAGSSLQVIGNTTSNSPDIDELSSTLEIVLSDARFPNGSIERLHLSSGLDHVGIDWHSASGHWTASLEKTTTRWASIKSSSLKGTIAPSSTSAALIQPLVGTWKEIQDLNITFTLATQDVAGPSFEAEALEIAASWEAPTLELERVKGSLYDGQFDFTGSLAADSRQATLQGAFDFDVHRINHLLTTKGQRWLEQYQFEAPPSVQVKASVTLPEWNDPQPDWRGEVKPTMTLDGSFEVGNAAFRTVPVTAASSSLSFSNMTWRLPNLTVHRPEGTVHLDYRCDADTQDYHWQIDALVDPIALAPILSKDQTKGLKFFQFRAPVKAVGEIWGRWYNPELTRLKTQIHASDFSFREQPITSLSTDLAYVNGLLTARNVAIERSEGRLQADLVQFNARNQQITLTNAVSTADTAAIATMIGPRIERSFQSYRFSSPPRISANGIIPIDGMGAADAHFDVKGGPFAFWRFNVPDIEAKVDWVGREVTINDVQAPFYDGTLVGEMALQLKRGRGADFELDATVRDSNLNQLFGDVLSPESKSQGSLSGHIVIESGQTDDWNSWQGKGRVKLREGLLWDTPLFGIFSPVLNTVSPGLGNSRAEWGEASFRITDSIIHTSDLVIQEPSTRLQYQGALDFEGNLDARVEAELLRDAPMVGRVVSMALWPVSKLFVYKLGGNLREPIAEPVYVLPKFLMNPLNSLRNKEN